MNALRGSLIALGAVAAAAVPAFANWGDWQAAPGEVSKLEAKATSEGDGRATLLLTCSDQAGFEIRIDKGIGKSPPAQEMHIIVDGNAPVAIHAVPTTPEISFVSLVAHNAEGVERAVSGARRIGIRFDEGFGSMSTYYFDFANLKAGQSRLLSVCPA